MNTSFKTLLIDDEPLARARLRRLLNKFEATFEIIGEAANGAEGLTLVEELQPDVIFLDIEMPLMNGFEMLSQLTFMPMVIFATAYDQYAIRAFEENSIDYLLKPIENDRLEKTVEKLKKRMASPQEETTQNAFNSSLLQIIEQFKPKKDLHTISVKFADKILLIPLDEISYFEAEDKYVFLATKEGYKYLTSYTVATLEEKLPDHFTRVSRSAILNSRHVREIQKHFDGKFILVLNDKKGSKITSGQSFAENVRRLFEL
ncbi:LytR/AlgR family response regulator transcription factor [Runella aurantiaca]|uniref:Response regulator n=1 Tax=Runella aurantiaca TaxID=2282308 RepID=A0A369I5Q1_9BACT|nr:response regulator [Runella aurantiaca]RDB04230.1 response regulator [Runella aurantiaca]